MFVGFNFTFLKEDPARTLKRSIRDDVFMSTFSRRNKAITAKAENKQFVVRLVLDDIGSDLNMQPGLHFYFYYE